MGAPRIERPEDVVFSQAAIDDPYPFYAAWRRAHPLARIGETGVHAVATWTLIEEVLERGEDFSANLTGVLMRDDEGDPATFPLPEAGGSHVIATADDPEHAVHRAIVAPSLSGARVAALAAPVRAWAQEGVAAWLAGPDDDFVPVAERIPARAVARLLGLPDEDVARFRVWAMMGGEILAGDIDQAGLVKLATETGQMAEYLGVHLDRCANELDLCAESTDDEPLLRSLARAVAGGRIDRNQAVGIAIVMFGAGGESTAALIGSCVRHLAERPGLQRELREDPARISRFVEEVVRLDPPFKFHYRVVKRACQLGGFDLEPGDRLMLLWASANRDPAVFEDPDAMRFDRKHPKHHMGFGRGGHFCVGAGLARLEARAVIEALLASTRNLRAGPAEYARSIFIRRLERLPVFAEAR